MIDNVRLLYDKYMPKAVSVSNDIVLDVCYNYVIILYNTYIEACQAGMGSELLGAMDFSLDIWGGVCGFEGWRITKKHNTQPSQNSRVKTDVSMYSLIHSLCSRSLDNMIYNSYLFILYISSYH